MDTIEIEREMLENMVEKADEILVILERIQRNCDEGLKAAKSAMTLIGHTPEQLAF